MRGYVEMMERLERLAPEGHTVTDAEVEEAMIEQMAHEIDAAREYRREHDSNDMER